MSKGLSLNEIVEMLEAEDNIEATAIIIEPPENATSQISDEDSGDEEDGTINNLPGSLLRAPAHLVYDGDFNSILDDEVASTSTAQELPRTKKIKLTKVARQWKNTDLDPRSPKGRIKQPQQITAKTPIEIFKLFWDDKVVEMIVTYTNLYASENGITLGLSHSELKCVLGIIFLSGYVPLPRRRMYWEQRADTHNTMVSGAMRRDRFSSIFGNLHVADNANLEQEDKFAKLRPLISELNKRCLKFTPNETNFSFDESMVPYFGRHGCKQFIRGKPIRFGFKFWCGATRLGYICWFQPYQGKNPNTQYQEYGVGASVVLQFVEALTKEHPGEYHFIFDNFFTSISLLDKLASMGHQATGTVRKDRIDKPPLHSDEIMKKKERGAFDFRSDKVKAILSASGMTTVLSLLPLQELESILLV